MSTKISPLYDSDNLITTKCENFENLYNEHVYKFSIEFKKEITWLKEFLEYIVSSYSHRQIINDVMVLNKKVDIKLDEDYDDKLENQLEDKLQDKLESELDKSEDKLGGDTQENILENISRDQLEDTLGNILAGNLINNSIKQPEEDKLEDQLRCNLEDNLKDKLEKNQEKEVNQESKLIDQQMNQSISNIFSNQESPSFQQVNKVISVEEKKLIVEENMQRPLVQEEKTCYILDNLFEDFKIFLDLQQEKTLKDLDQTNIQQVEGKKLSDEYKKNQINPTKGKCILPEINSDSSSEEEDYCESSKPQNQIPDWCQSSILEASLIQQAALDPEIIFGKVQPLDMMENGYKFRQRTSSANWSGSDALTEKEDLEYKKIIKSEQYNTTPYTASRIIFTAHSNYEIIFSRNVALDIDKYKKKFESTIWNIIKELIFKKAIEVSTIKVPPRTYYQEN
ncbi:9279_t:CDS:2 [Entrophospora sp. SA101]|nr:9279_t:CDS:2 [Entrophospora sp. SA101]